MRSTLLLASFLAVIPLISATPSHVETVRQAGPSLVPFVQLLNGNSWNFSLCISSNLLTSPGNIPSAPATLTTYNCVNACDGEGFTQAGIGGGGYGNQSCTCGTGVSVDSLNFTQCVQNSCLGDPQEACGSDYSQVYYLKI